MEFILQIKRGRKCNMKIKFLRRVGNRFSKLGKGRKKQQKWRKPTGRDNKMREKRKGYPVVVKIGYKQNKKLSGAINEKTPVVIMNIKNLKKIKKNEVAIIGKVGQKNKIEIAKIAKEKKIQIYNLNVKKFLHKQERAKTSKEKKEEKSAQKNESSIKKDIQTNNKTKLKNNKDESKK